MALYKACVSCSKFKFSAVLCKSFNSLHLLKFGKSFCCRNDIIFRNCTAYFSSDFNICKRNKQSYGIFLASNSYICCSRTHFSPQICTHRYFSSEKSLLSLCPDAFAEFLKKNKINRCFFIWSDSEQRVVASHSELKEIEDWLNNPDNPQYKKHEAIFFTLGMRTCSLLAAFLWKVERGQTCGGIQMVPFTSMKHLIDEGLKLSRRLGVKAALAGLWIGGGKGLIPEPKDRQHIQPEFRQKIFYDYGDFVSSLNGCFIAGMDTGVNTFDLYNVHSRTRWVVSGPEDIGGSGNAAVILGQGLLCGMEAALNYLGAGNLSGMKVAVQGAGGIGLAVTSGLLDRGAAHVYVTDTSKKSIGDLYDALMTKALFLGKRPLESG